MSKQTQANTIVAASTGLDKQTIIDEIMAQTDSGAPYAATLYRNANKAKVAGVTEVNKPSKDGRMTEFTNDNLDLMRKDIQMAVDAIGEEHGVNIKLGNIRFDSDRLSFTSKLAVNIGSASDKAKSEWNKYCDLYGFKKSDFGKTFTTPKGKKYKLTGINPKARKFPVNAVSVPGGSEYGFPENISKLLK